MHSKLLGLFTRWLTVLECAGDARKMTLRSVKMKPGGGQLWSYQAVAPKDKTDVEAAKKDGVEFKTQPAVPSRKRVRPSL